MKRLFLIGGLVVVAVLFARPRGAKSSRAAVLGRTLRRLRSGDARSALNDPVLRTLPQFDLHSVAFADGAALQAPYIDAGALAPPLSWSGVPAEAVELALIIEDIDVPLPAPLVHAVAYGIDPGRGSLDAGAIPRIAHPGEGDRSIRLGRGAGGRRFLPPTPIPGHGPHRYVFEAFALREPLNFRRPPNKRRLLRALRKVAIARGVTIGTHERT